MPETRLDVTKTYKLFIDGKFPRSERPLLVVHDDRAGVLAHVCNASRKDLRDAVSAARAALPKWKSATAYNRGQVLYRIAEMMEGKRDELSAALASSTTGAARKSRLAAALRETSVAIDRMVHYAGWADKFAQMLGCNNAVAGPYYNFTVPEATGVVGILAPDQPGLLGFISLVAPVICSGNTCVALAGESPAAQLSAVIMGEVIATSDVPPGVVNILTGARAEILAVMAQHRDVDAVLAAGLSTDQARTLREGVAENLKRVRVIDLAGPKAPGRAARGVDLMDESAQSPAWIEPFVEFKTIWHPSAT